MTEALAPDSRSVTVRAPAKINLHLGVGALRADGFHPLDTIYQAVSLYDDVSVVDAEHWSVEVSPIGDVDVSEVPLDSSNIAIRAGQLLTAHHDVQRFAQIHLAKGIPVAGGMAGGSADAAATLVALDRLWDLGTPDDDLLAIASELGSDVPFSLLGGTARGTGRGEVVEPVGDTGTWWWVVVPDPVGLSTPAVYRAFDETEHAVEPSSPADTLAALLAGDEVDLGEALRNDLAAAALGLRPDLEITVAALSAAGARAVLLSGSGPTYLGLADSQEHAMQIRESLGAAGLPAVVATGPVAGAHVVEYN